MNDYLVVLVTASDETEAKSIAKKLLEKKLIACANLMPVQSLYTWNDEMQEDKEVLMIIKTTSASFIDALEPAIKDAHSYDVPEIIGMPIVMGSAEYLQWISENVELDT